MPVSSLEGSSSSSELHCDLGGHWPRKIIVCLNLGEASLELLLWAVVVAAHPGDSIVALHLTDQTPSATKTRDNQAIAESVLGAAIEKCRSLCHFRQVKADIRIVVGGASLESVLVELGAAMVVLGVSDVRYVPSFRPKCVISKESGHGWHALPTNWLHQAESSAQPNGNEVSNTLLQARVLEEEQKQQQTYSRFGCSSSEEVHVSLDTANDYSPRGVLEGPSSDSSHGSSPVSNNGESPCFSSKPLLSPSNLNQEDSDEETQASCLMLFKHMNIKRQISFPPATAKPKNFISSLSRSFNMRFSAEEDTIAVNDKSPWQCFTYVDLSTATNGFHPDNLVGKGGYAEVYKGRLPDGQLIAVKKLTKGDTNQQKEGGFLTELGIIGHVCHPNTTSLIGFCLDKGLHLVFPYSCNGSLASLLHGGKAKTVEWHIRFEVALGVAKGLHYLHKQCPRRIIHRDIKSSNILLGPDFKPQISDFGLAKWLPEQWTHHTVTPIEGTFGYLAPEYFMHGIVDEKTDVFSYGVLLLEIITGRRPIDSSQRNLVVWARPHLEACNVQQLVDPKLTNYDMEQLRRLVLTATLCVRQSPLWRPCMHQVLRLLTDDTLDNWSTLVCNSTEIDDEYSSKEYNTDLSKHRALAFDS